MTAGEGAKADPTLLVQAHRPYCHSVAKELLGHLPPHIDRDDVLGWADLGLMEAAQAFDPSRGVSFRTFSYYRIRGAILDGVRKSGWLNRREYHNVRLRQRTNELLQVYADLPDQPAADAGAGLEDLRRISGSVAVSCVLSLEELHGEPADPRVVPADEDVAVLENRERIRDCLSRLPERNRELLIDYYYRDITLEQIGQRMGLSKSWISRIHAKSLELLRDLLTGTVKDPMQLTSDQLRSAQEAPQRKSNA